MQQAGQVSYLDRNDAHEQSLGQSDGSLPGPEQTLNQSINQSIDMCCLAVYSVAQSLASGRVCAALFVIHTLKAQLGIVCRHAKLV